MSTNSLAPRIPATLISGYLGAGKTTLINHLLRGADGRRITVLVNDFGDINIDADLIESRDDDLISLSGGCVCCSFGSDLIAAVTKLTQSRVPPQHLLIEISGVALPAAVASGLRLADGVALEAIVVLADAETIARRLCDRYVGDTVRSQLAAADVIVLNKADLVTSDALASLAATLATIAPRSRLIITQRSAVAPAVLLGWRQEHGLSALAAATDRLADHAPRRRSFLENRALSARPDPFVSVSLRFNAPIDAEQLAASLADPQLGLYRAKVLARRPDGTAVTIQVVAARFEVHASIHRDPQQGRLMCVGARGRLNEAQIRRRLTLASR